MRRRNCCDAVAHADINVLRMILSSCQVLKLQSVERIVAGAFHELEAFTIAGLNVLAKRVGFDVGRTVARLGLYLIAPLWVVS